MHPMEHLRYVARASGADDWSLVRECASALVSVVHDPIELVAACKRIVDHQPQSAALVHVAAALLTSTDPDAARRRVLAAFDADPTARELAHALPDEASVCAIGPSEEMVAAFERRGDLDVVVVDTGGFGPRLVHGLEGTVASVVDVPAEGLGLAASGADVVLVAALAATDDRLLTTLGGRAAAATARAHGRQTWVVVPWGRHLPARMFDGVLDRLGEHVDDVAMAARGLDVYETVASELFDRRIVPPDDEPCPDAPELYRAA